MKYLKLALLFTFISLPISCFDKSTSGKQYKTIADKSNVFKVRILAEFPEKDFINLYYLNGETPNFSEQKVIRKMVEGLKKEEEIVFSLPQNYKPTQLRIDFGKNLHQKNIVLKKIEMSYKGKGVELPGTLIFSYFIPDFTKTTFNPTTGTLHGIVRNGKAQSPSLYPKGKVLQAELENLLK